MVFKKNIHEPIAVYRIILTVLLIEILVYFFSGLNTNFLYGNTFFSLEQDPLLWAAYYTGIPQFIVQHVWVAIFLDIAILLLLCWLVVKPLNVWVARLLLLFLILFYVVVVGHHTHRNFQTGYIFVLLLFVVTSTNNKQILFECLRYFLLIFYVMAAYLKITSGALFNATHMSHALAAQFAPYFTEQRLGWRTALNSYLVQHTLIAQSLLITATIVEALAIVGFFTKKYDFLIALFLLIFHFANWFLMDIAPIGHIAFLSILFFSKQLCWINKASN